MNFQMDKIPMEVQMNYSNGTTTIWIIQMDNIRERVQMDCFK